MGDADDVSKPSMDPLEGVGDRAKEAADEKIEEQKESIDEKKQEDEEES